MAELAGSLDTVTHLRPVPDIKSASREGEETDRSIAELERWATVLRMRCVSMLAVAKSGHLDSSLSAADIVAALYYRVLRHDSSQPDWPERDRFVLSKGHAAPILYAALAEHGYFPLQDLMGLRKIGAHLQGHPDMNRTPGVEVSTGSLGQGLSMSVGICLALRLDRLDQTAHTFTLLSDGDCQEGETWEGATAAAHFGVQNLTAIVDYNHLQTDGTTEEVMDIGDVRAKFEAFGWDAVEIDGHDMSQILEALERSRTLDRPAAIVCQTKKGRGVSFMEGRFGYHGKPPSPEQAEEALSELEATSSARRTSFKGSAMGSEDGADCNPPRVRRRARRARRGARGRCRPRRRLAVSTQSIKFGKRFPERFFNVGAAEAGMMSMACGLAATGKVPYCSTFAIFATGRSYDQVRLGIAHNELKVQDRRPPRRRLAGRGWRLAPDDRGHRADAGDAEDAGHRPRRLQPGLPGDARVL